ncbi:hypothetical protein EGT51_11470 [Levilactobacillus suantsaiihabitans]|uniref:Uncharacterized protein n=1 Tax=Levilactobacillus suantsaiihabitans TaxID=2487722 RepID=A0A4Z0J6V0_9LACO|nr:hypothetical protein EGT51_11470 [Levilactobacillus suantsaiihabitans]
MEPAVSAVLPGVVCQVTARDDLRDWPVLPGFQARRKTAPQAGVVPQSRPHPSLTQAPGFTNLQNTVIAAISALILGSTFN